MNELVENLTYENVEKNCFARIRCMKILRLPCKYHTAQNDMLNLTTKEENIKT